MLRTDTTTTHPRPNSSATMTISLPRESRGQREFLPTLQVVAGREMLRFITIPEGQEIVLGRGQDADLVLDDPSISRRHALISYDSPGRLLIQDLGSTNGISVNGYAVRRSLLRPGDSIELGAVSLRLDLLTPDELSHLGRVQEKLESAGTDPLTGLRNRTWLAEELPRVLDRLDETERTVSGIFFDVDHFKQINDAHGHPVGDEVLRTIGKIALVEVRDQDVCVRYGGEEIFVVLPRTDAEAAGHVAERIRLAMVKHDWQRTADGLVVTASFGVAERERGESAESWIARADKAMYAAKDAGRNAVALD